jgi:hypothetical protein
MTTPLVPPMLIDPPAPPGVNYGLLTVATGPLDLPVHAAGGGLEWIPDSCGVVRLYQNVCDPTPQVKTFDPIDTKANATPYKIYSTIKCGTLGFSFDEFEGRVRRRLNSVEQSGIEAAFWGAEVGDNQGYLQSAAITVTDIGATTTVVKAIAGLEQQLASCYPSKVGVIHARPIMAAYLSSNRLIYWKNDRCYTYRGNLVVFGDGYSGLDPAGNPPDATHEHIYATGRVLIWRSPDVFVPDPRQTLDRTLNQQNLLAERDVAVAVECCAAFTKVTLP